MFASGFEKTAAFSPMKHADSLMLRVAEKFAKRGLSHTEALEQAMSMSKPDLYKELGMSLIKGGKKVLKDAWTGTPGAIKKVATYTVPPGYVSKGHAGESGMDDFLNSPAVKSYLAGEKKKKNYKALKDVTAFKQALNEAKAKKEMETQHAK